jgi:hypothetical protein
MPVASEIGHRRDPGVKLRPRVSECAQIRLLLAFRIRNPRERLSNGTPSGARRRLVATLLIRPS